MTLLAVKVKFFVDCRCQRRHNRGEKSRAKSIGDADVQKMVLMQQVTRKLQNLVDQMAAQK